MGAILVVPVCGMALWAFEWVWVCDPNCYFLLLVPPHLHTHYPPHVGATPPCDWSECDLEVTLFCDGYVCAITVCYTFYYS